MTVSRRRLQAGELDHEVVWGWVCLSCGALAALCLATIGPPPWVCVFKSITGLPCLTCGATRAVAALVDGRVLDSLRLNPLVPFGALAALVYTPYALASAHLGLPRIRISVTEREASYVRGAVLVGLALNWSYLIAVGR